MTTPETFPPPIPTDVKPFYRVLLPFLGGCRFLLLSAVLTGMVLVTGCTGEPGLTDYRFYKETKPLSIRDVSARLFTGTKGTVNDGARNGTYWIYIPTEELQNGCVYRFPSEHMADITCYQGGTEQPCLRGVRYPTYRFTEAAEPVFFRIRCSGEAYIPLSRYPEGRFEAEEPGRFLIIGAYYGTVLTMILLNLSLGLIFRDRTFLYYGLFSLCILLSLFFSDGLFDYFNIRQYVQGRFEPVVHALAAIFGALFAGSFLLLHEYWKHSRKALFLFAGSLLLLAVACLFIRSYVLFVVLEFLVLFTLFFYWICGIRYIRETAFAPLFVFGYMPILFFGIRFYLARTVGLAQFGVSMDTLRTGGLFEMVLLTCTVLYRMKLLHTLNREMKREIAAYMTRLESLQQEQTRYGPENLPGGIELSDREQQVIRLIREGRSNKEIGAELCISENTVKYHVKKIFEKLRISSRKDIRRVSAGLAPEGSDSDLNEGALQK